MRAGGREGRRRRRVGPPGSRQRNHCVRVGVRILDMRAGGREGRRRVEVGPPGSRQLQLGGDLGIGGRAPQILDLCRRIRRMAQIGGVLDIARRVACPKHVEHGFGTDPKFGSDPRGGGAGRHEARDGHRSAGGSGSCRRRWRRRLAGGSTRAWYQIPNSHRHVHQRPEARLLRLNRHPVEHREPRRMQRGPVFALEQRPVGFRQDAVGDHRPRPLLHPGQAVQPQIDRGRHACAGANAHVVAHDRQNEGPAVPGVRHRAAEDDPVFQPCRDGHSAVDGGLHPGGLVRQIAPGVLAQLAFDRRCLRPRHHVGDRSGADLHHVQLSPSHRVPEGDDIDGLRPSLDRIAVTGHGGEFKRRRLVRIR